MLTRPPQVYQHVCMYTSWIMPMNSEKAQFSWLRTLLRNEAAISLSVFSSSAMCLCSSNEGHGSGPITVEQQICQNPQPQSIQKIRSWTESRQTYSAGLAGSCLQVWFSAGEEVECICIQNHNPDNTHTHTHTNTKKNDSVNVDSPLSVSVFFFSQHLSPSTVEPGSSQSGPKVSVRMELKGSSSWPHV